MKRDLRPPVQVSARAALRELLRRGTIVLLAAALLWQGVVAQTHVHRAWTAAAGSAAPAWSAADRSGLPGAPDDAQDARCPICQILHAGGAFLVAVGPAVAAPAAVDISPVAARARPPAPPRYVLARSRAPPAAS